jgi:hypothetical protein
MSSHGLIALVVALVFALSRVAGVAADRQITDVEELAGTWQGVNSQLSGSARVLRTIKADGSYQSSSSRDGGTLTVGQYYLDGGQLKYRSSRTAGSAVVSEDKGQTTLTVKPEGSYNQNTGPATYERVKWRALARMNTRVHGEAR